MIKLLKFLRSVNNLDLKKNFILSGMNLAFLGYYSKKKVYPQKFLYHWPDGIFIRNIINIKKIPGRDIIKKIKLKKNIKSIKIIGNISNKSKIYLKKLFKLKIYHEKLPYGPIEKLLKKNIKIKKNQITLLHYNT